MIPLVDGPGMNRPGGRLRRLSARALVGLALVASAVFCAVAAEWVAPANPNAQQLRFARQPPSWMPKGGSFYVLGTDHLGRDVFSRLLYGARVSLAVAFGSVAIGVLFGGGLGLVAGSARSKAGDLLMRLIDIQMAIPTIVMAIVLVGILGPSVRNVMIVFGLAGYPTFARLVRGEMLQLRERDFTTAAHAVGASAQRVILRHLLPNLLGPVLALAVLEMAAVILYESGLGFLGLSVPPRIPSWGGMLADGRQYLTSAWWMALFPGLAIMTTVLGLNLAGEWIHAKLAPEIWG